jgi:hypothetical protein
MADDDQEWVDYKSSTFGSFAVQAPKKKRKKRSADKRVPPKRRGEQGGGGGTPLGRSVVRN